MPQGPDNPLRPGTLGILLACLLVQLLIWRNHAGQAKAIKKASLARRLSLEAGRFNPFLLIASLFAHVDWLHFAFNAWILLLVGSLMEGYWGTRAYLVVCAAGGLAGQVAFLIFGDLGGVGDGHTLTGLSGVIAALGSAYLRTHGGEAVPYPAPEGFGSAIAVSPRLCIGIWCAGMPVEAVWLGGFSGGASLSTLVAGGLAGLIIAKQVPGTLPRYRAA